MRGELTRGIGIGLLLVVLVMPFVPETQAQSPEYRLVFVATTSESIRWNTVVLGRTFGPSHLYGNFCIALEDVSNVDYMTVNHWAGGPSDSEWDEYLLWPMLLNDSSEPFEWRFSTLDFSVGLHRLAVMAHHHYDGDWGVLASAGSTFTLYFEHEDGSQTASLLNGMSMGLQVGYLIIGVALVLVEIRRRAKKQVMGKPSARSGTDSSRG